MGSRAKKEGAYSTWEDAEFPVLCETCLGDNPYVRMTKRPFGAECKVCARPFTTFRWRPGPRARPKKTEICQTCAKVKNLCQTCLLDLQYGLPAQVRDTATPSTDMIPQSDVNREYFADQAERKLASGEISWGKAAPSHMLSQLARTTPYYKRNAPHVCSFFVKGTCNRGAECPYRHEMPPDKDSALAKQNIKDRYYGTNDPVAAKMMGQFNEKALKPPADQEIKTLWVGGVTPAITEQDIRDVFYSFGELQSVNMMVASQCAFVTYTDRAAAETAAEKLFGTLTVKGSRLRLSWGNRQLPGAGGAAAPTGAGFFQLPSSSAGVGPSATGPAAVYPSMNPATFGSKPDDVVAPPKAQPNPTTK